jgi:hypothetical protein
MADVTSQGVLSAIARKNAGGVTTITDDFNRANSELSASASAEGWSWVNAATDTLSIVSNAVQLTLANKATRYYANSSLGGPDMEAQITINNEFLTSTSAAGVAARLTDGSNYYFLNRSHNTDDFKLYKRVATVETQLGTAYTADPTPPYTMKIVVNGDQISGYVNGTLRIGPITDTALTTGNFAGISGFANGSNFILTDDFTASSL